MGKLISFLHFLYFTLLWVYPFFSILICYVYFFLCEWIKLRNINLRFIAWLWLVQLHCCWEYHILSLYLWNEMGCFMFSISNSWSQCYKCCKPRCFCIVLKNDKISRIFDRLKKNLNLLVPYICWQWKCNFFQIENIFSVVQVDNTSYAPLNRSITIQ